LNLVGQGRTDRGQVVGADLRRPAGGVYVADSGNNRVLELGAGSTAPNQLPFNGSTDSVDVAVDSAGSIYVSGDHRVWKLAAGSRSQVELPFGNMRNPTGVAVDDEVHHPERRLDDRGRSSWVRR
jgi:hypothetical protein